MKDLQRSIGLRDLTLGVVGGVIGSGIFLVPGGVLSQSGNSIGVAMMVWIVGGVLTFLGALTYGELGAMTPETGGLYLYLRDAYGFLVAFMYGWALFFAIAAGAIGVLSSVSADYIAQFLPLGAVGKKVTILIIIGSLTWLNVRGTTLGVGFMSIATALKVAALLFLIVALPLAKGFGNLETSLWPDRWDADVFQAFGAAMLMVLFAYEGWQFSTFISGEVVNPQRNLPLGLALGTLILLLIYVFANIAYLSALGVDGVAGTTTVAADAVSTVFGTGPAALITIPIIISMISAAHFVILSSARVYFAMARDGVFFRRLGVIHPRFNTPAFALVVGSLAGATLAMLGTVQQLLSYVVFIGWIFYGLGAMSLIVFRRTRPDVHRPFRVPAYPIAPLLFAFAALALVINTIFTQSPKETILGLGLVALGLPAYAAWRRG